MNMVVNKLGRDILAEAVQKAFNDETKKNSFLEKTETRHVNPNV